VALVMCGVLALGALDGDIVEPLPIFQRRRAARSIAWKVHMGDMLLWAAVGTLFVAGALALLAV
jgi:hypothetical protein